MSESTRYVVIEETDYFGPSASHAIARDDAGAQLPIFETLADARAAVPPRTGPVTLGWNEAAANTSVWRVVREIDGSDWCEWPSELEDAANRILAEIGLDPEDPTAAEDLDFDLAAAAARRIGMCVATLDADDCCLLCEPVD